MQIFGIRHHGPGSARSLKKALVAYQPDMVLVEGPPDADGILKYVDGGALLPPVAILVYNPKALNQAAYFPFSPFSPEWQAIKYAHKQNIPVKFMDLPHSIHFGLANEAETAQLELIPEEGQTEGDKNALQLQKDPMGYMAKLAGFTDSERWWEATFEHIEATEEIFSAVLEMMTEMRAASEQNESPETLMREAYMRKIIRKAVKDGYQKIAIVCGAWHSPALADLKKFKISSDNKILKGLKKVKTQTTWIPWTYERLSKLSGYGAGVLSPAWYGMLHSNRKNVVIRWMTKVAHLLRKEDLDASSAHIIEAVRLAETLATLRGLPIAGIEELDEAAKTIFCGGYDEPMEVIRKKLIIGQSMGRVGEEVPVIPLQKDLEKLIKSTRLTKYKINETQWLKGTEKNPEGGIDVREANDLTKSLLLHRLLILGIDWGKKKEAGQGDLGSFKEKWKLKWKVGFALSIIEAGMWGNTVLNAANNYVLKTGQETEKLSELAKLVDLSIDADLKSAIPRLANRLKNLAAVTKDVHQLMEALPTLVKKLRYGTARKADLSSLTIVANQIIPRIFISLPTACQALDEDATEKMFEHIQNTNQSLSILNNDEHLEGWHKVLKQLANMTTINGKLQGTAVRILYDKSDYTIEEAAQKMSYALSMGNDAIAAAQWIEGFLHGSALLLIHNPGLWNILDNWVDLLPFENFQDLLPLLRRTFSNFAPPERQKMMQLAQQGQVKKKISEVETVYVEERVQQMIPTLRLLLGIEG